MFLGIFLLIVLVYTKECGLSTCSIFPLYLFKCFENFLALFCCVHMDFLIDGQVYFLFLLGSLSILVMPEMSGSEFMIRNMLVQIALWYACQSIKPGSRHLFVSS